MKQNKLQYAKETILRLYKSDPSSFDTKSNSPWLLLYITKWLGVRMWNERFIDMRMKLMPYETFRRAVQQLIHDGEIVLSTENLLSRHRSNIETKEALKQPTWRDWKLKDPMLD